MAKKILRLKASVPPAVKRRGMHLGNHLIKSIAQEFECDKEYCETFLNKKNKQFVTYIEELKEIPKEEVKAAKKLAEIDKQRRDKESKEGSAEKSEEKK